MNIRNRTKKRHPGGGFSTVRMSEIDINEAREKKIAQQSKMLLEAFKNGKEQLQSISHYEVIRELGHGGMGTVFLAEHVSDLDIRKTVAIKVLNEMHNQQAMERLIEEARILVRLSQGTIVELLALESKEITLPGRKNPRTGHITPPTKRKLYFMVQEYVNGPGFNEVLLNHGSRGLLICPAMVGFILNKAVIALSEAHGLCDEKGHTLGLVHRDISPSNLLFMAKTGITKLADFGVAKAFCDFGASSGGNKQHIVGKLRYMAPEQLNGLASPKSDIWSLGVIGYEALVGYAPYKVIGSTVREKVKHLKEQFAYRLRPPAEAIHAWRDHFVANDISEIIMRCLVIDPNERPSAAELNAMLESKYLYNKGLGPTNKTLAAYFALLDCAVGEGDFIVSPNYVNSPAAQTIRATLKVDNPLDVFPKRATSSYRKEFLLALKAKEVNPCLQHKNNNVFTVN